MSILDKVRRWIDGESAELVLEQAARDAQVKPRSKSEEFIVKIARAIEAVMQSEMLPLPQGTTIIPTEYIVFLSDEDDKEWQGIKRRGLLQGLYHILSERARELAGKRKLETGSFAIELRVDATLEKGDVRVQHSWEDANNKTGVFARPKNPSDLPKSPAPQPSLERAAPLETSPNIVLPRPNAPLTSANVQIHQAEPIPPEGGEEMTQVGARRTELYKLEVWQGGVRKSVIPVFKKEIVVGRGSKSKPVDIVLPGDVEVSRRHVTLIADQQGNFWVINEGKNPATVNDYELPTGQPVPLIAGVPLVICSYMLRIQPQ